MKRRDFLKIAPTVGAASLIFDGCGKPEKLIPLLVAPDEFVPYEEGWVHSLCQSCSAGCGLTVRVMQGESIRTVDGQEKRVKAVMAKKIEGNPDHPISMGGTCARGQASVQALYHPDRLQHPMKLSGPRGSGQYQPIAWKDAVQLLVTQLQQQQATPQGVAVLTGRKPRGTMGTVLERFTAGYGTTNVVAYDPFDPAPIRKAMELTTGKARLPVVDFANAHYLLSFNANLFETFLSPVKNIHSYGVFRQGRPGIRGKFVQAEPRLSQTAACADEWLPIKPGTEGLLALSMAHVIVNEQLHDKDFVAQGTTGFAEWSAALANFAPEAVAPQVDIKADQITRIAREFATRRPSVAIGDSRDVNSLVAIYALNALVGAYGKPGGILPGGTLDDADGALTVPDAPGKGAPAPAAPDILGLISAMSGNRVKALLVFDTNPLFTLPEQDKLRDALGSVPFIVSFSSFLDETSAMADLILPNHVPLERWADDVPEPGVGFPVRTLGQPVVQPRWDTRDSGDVLLEVAKALGGKPADALPFDTMAAAVKESFRPAHAMNAGNVTDDDFNAFYKKAVAAGGWWNPEGIKAQGSGLKQAGRVVSSPAFKFAVPAVTPRVFAGNATQFPFFLHVYPSAAFADGRTAHLPWLQEMPDPMTTVMWGSWVEISPQAAEKLAIHEGDVLAVTSPQGSLELPVYIYPGLRPDVIAIPVGQGHTQYGRYATNRGANPLKLATTTIDPVSGSAVQSGVRVNVARTGRLELPIRFGSDAREIAETPLHR
jgi:menaquinone reductase, molybdopterin-binding-like subunit